MKEVIILIGPIRAGKSTVAQLLSERLCCPRCKTDLLRFGYYKEAGYDEAMARKIENEKGFLALVEYWKLFDVYTVNKIMQDFACGVIDFGGGLSVYEKESDLSAVTDILRPYKNVILLLPSPDVQESLKILSERMEEKEYQEYFQAAGILNRKELNKHFLEHHSNKTLAKHIVYTKDKSPAQTCSEIIKMIEM